MNFTPPFPKELSQVFLQSIGGGGAGGGDLERGPQSVQSVPYAQVSPVTFTSPTAPSWQCVLLSYGPPRPPE